MHSNKHVRLGIEGTLAVLIIVAVGFLTMLRMDGATADDSIPPRGPIKVTLPVEEDCVPTAAWTETIVDAEAYDETVPNGVQHYSLKGNSGIEKDEVPVFPADYWQANAQLEPHEQGNGEPATWVDESLHYTSHGSEGKRDWFYLEHLTTVVHHDAVTHDVEHPAVTCEDDPTEEPNPDRPVRSQQCVGNDLVVTVEFPNGNIEHTSHVNAAQCSTVTEDTPEHSVGTPRRLDAPKVVVEEEGM